MPVMDGLEATGIILALETGIPIVAMTANIMSHDRELYRNSGMADYVGKPFTSQELWRCLMKFFTPISWKIESKSQREQVENELRQKLIIKFVVKNRDKYDEIMNAINTGDIKLAHRLAHTIKSNAGQLVKHGLQQAADEIENSLKNGENLVSQQQLDTFNEELNMAIAEFEPMVQEQLPVADPSEQLSNDAIRELLAELEVLLEESDPECLTFTDKLRSIPGSNELIQQIEDFEFKTAIKLLAELKKEIGYD